MKEYKRVYSNSLSSGSFMQVKNQQGVLKKYVQTFNTTVLQKYQLRNTIDFNEAILCNIQQRIFPESFLQIQSITEDEKNKKLYIVQNVYQYNLQERMDKQLSNEKQALQIFSDIMKSIYSICIEGLVHRNIRPEHFAFADGCWKLKSLVFTNETNGLDKSEFVWNPFYQAPQQYQTENKQQPQLQPLVVWYLGSLLLDLLLGTHILGNQKILRKFKNKPFSLSAIGSKVKLSPNFQQLLGKMLHYNYQQRPSLQEIFENELLCKQVAVHFKQYRKKSHSKIGADLRSSNAFGKSSIKGSIMKSVSSIRSSKTEQNYNIILPQIQLLSIDEDPKMQQLMSSQKKNIRESQNIVDDDDFFMDLKQEVTKFQKPSNKIQKDRLYEIKQLQSGISGFTGTNTKLLKKKQVKINQTATILNIGPDEPDEPDEPNPTTLENYQQLKDVFYIYKTFIDRSELLCIAAQKFAQIPYDQFSKDQLFNLNRFCVYYASLIELNRIVNSLNSNKNIYRINEDKFNDFIESE